MHKDYEMIGPDTMCGDIVEAPATGGMFRLRGLIDPICGCSV